MLLVDKTVSTLGTNVDPSLDIPIEEDRNEEEELDNEQITGTEFILFLTMLMF